LQNIDELNGNTFNIGGGVAGSVSLCELTELCRAVTGNYPKVSSIKETRIADIKIYITDNSEIQKATGWKPLLTPLKIVQDTAKWLQARGDSIKHIFD
jgi:CDP-paratose 2-epimerase